MSASTHPASSATGDARTITVDFHRGTQGFVAGFADLPDTSNETYELMSGFEQLPPPLAPEMALLISGANRSDDLFMFFRGQIGGLVPGVRYNATVSVEIATDTPSGCFGIAGNRRAQQRLLAKRVLPWKNRDVDRRNISTAIVFGSWLAFAPAHAHHSWAGIYDSQKSITVEGVVTEFLLRSPHLALLIDARNDAGETEQWTVEWGNRRWMLEAGYDESVLKPGDLVIVTGQPAWTPGRKSVRMRSLTRPADGFALSGRQRR